MKTAIVLAVCASVLMGCGGGGGGSGSSGNSTTAPNTSTSLVPAAPASGAVLAADATASYPLRSGATWHYRGSSSLWLNGQPQSYTYTYFSDSLSHASSADGGVIESSSNAFDGGASQSRVTHDAGNVVTSDINTSALASTALRTTLGLSPTPRAQRQALSATTAATSSTGTILLRSPIRTDDQWTLRDVQGASAGEDFDGDGRIDTYDEGFYARVMGMETIDLQSLKGINAVRVDYVQRVVVHYTSTRTASDVIETRISMWYAQNIGVVKTLLDEPTGQSDVRRHIAEELDTWDGVTEGIGALPNEPSFSVVNGVVGDRLGAPLDVLGMDDYALVVTPRVGITMTDGIAISVVDNRGRVVETHPYPGAVFFEPRLVRAGTSVMVVGRAWSGDPGWIAMTVDARGANASAPFYLASGSSSGSEATFRVAWDGSRVWMLWQESNATPTDNTLVRMHLAAYDAAGNTVVAARTLDDMPDIRDLSLTAQNGQGLAGWTVLLSGERTLRYVVLDGASSGSVRTEPVATGNTVAWATNTNRGFYHPRDTLNFALDVNGAVPTDASGNPIQQRWNPNQGTAETQWGVNAVAGEPDGSLVALQAGFISYWPDQTVQTYTKVISSYRLVQGAWQQALIGRAAWADMDSPQFVVPLSNRVLVVGSGGGPWMIAGAVWWRQ